MSGQAPIPASGKSYRLAFQGAVGKNDLGDISIDDIIFSESVCGGKGTWQIYFFIQLALYIILKIILLIPQRPELWKVWQLDQI